MRSIWYVYPIWHTVSFSLIAQRHIEQLRKYFRIEEIDELAFPSIIPHSKPLVLVHPAFYILSKYGKVLERRISKYRGIIGFDVADSDRISQFAVSITHYMDAMIVPSTFAKYAYIRSGVRIPIHVLPHGVPDEWFNIPPVKPEMFKDLWKIKFEQRKKLLLFICWHSEYRKGADLVLEFYSELRRERKDVVLVVKTMTPNGWLQDFCQRLGGKVVVGFLRERNLIELYDICDIYLLFSRGGGFELNGLEALARGEVVLAAKGGAWQDYLPDFCQVPSKPCEYVLKDNPIHIGKGIEVIIEKAIDKTHEILDNLEEYKAKVRDYVNRVVKEKFVWSVIGRRLATIISKYL